MLNIVYGPAGCGKSTYIYNKISDDLKAGKKTVLIVPDQYIYSAENMFADITNGINAFELEILGFRRLANYVFRQLGGLSYNDIDDKGRLLIMWRVLREVSPFLKVYGNVDKNSTSFSELMLNTITELKQFSITPSILGNVEKKLGEDNLDLKNKLYDLSFIYGTYQSFITNEFNDPSDELTRLAHTLNNSGFFNGHNVYFDLFDGFTAQQFDVIEQITQQADNSTLSLCYDPTDKTGIFKTTEKTYKIIKKMAERLNLSVNECFLNGKALNRPDDIAFVSKYFWDHNVGNGVFLGDNSHVNTIACHDKFEECEAVATDIIKKVRNGARFKDIVVIARDINEYDGIIDSQFENDNIPFYMSKRTDLTSKPLFKLVLSAFAVYNNNWRYNDVISFLKTGLAGVSYDEIDILEDYASTWNINGKRWIDNISWNMNPDGFVERISPEGEKIIATSNELRNKIVPVLTGFFDSIGGTTVKDITESLYNFLNELNIKEQLETKAAEFHNSNKITEENELIQLWNILINTLDIIVEFAGDMKLNGEDYVLMLSLILGKTNIGTIPSSIDQVIFGSASNLRVKSTDHVYLIGVNDGVFPKNAEENSIFSDNEKGILRSLNIDFSPISDEVVSDELYWFYRSIATAKESLTLTYAKSDLRGVSNRISVAGDRIPYLLNKEVIDYSSLPVIDRIQGKNTAIKLYSMNKDTEEGIALREYFKNDEQLNGLLKAFETCLSADISDIDKKTANKLYKGDIATSQSRIDSYVNCSFNYHCKYVLKLSEKKKSVFRGNDIGTFVHAILEKFMSKITDEDGLHTDITDSDVERLVDETVNDYVLYVCQGIPQSSPRMMQLIKRLRRTTLLLVQNILEEFRQSDFVPSFFELPIGKMREDGIEPYEISLDDGSKLYMHGFVDRVDTYKCGKDVYIRIIDYKTGTKKFSMSDIEKGLNLQMLLYLFALWNSKEKWFRNRIKCEGEILPAGILYYSAKAPTVNIKNDEDVENVYSNALNQIERNGILINDINVLKAMDKNLNGIYIPVKTLKDGSLRSSDCLKTIEEFGDLSNKVNAILNAIATDMKSGKIKADPIEKSSDKSPCRYCKMKPVCRHVNGSDDDE